MKKVIFSFLLFSFISTNAQKDIVGSDTSAYKETMPEYPGGEGALMAFFKENIQYPENAFENKIEGNVKISFVISRDGSLRDFKVVNGLGYGCDEEAIRVAKLMPNWKPAMQNGKAVPVQFTLPIKFSFDKEKNKRKKRKK